jgi:predicted site-specific integrase-resolvase
MARENGAVTGPPKPRSRKPLDIVGTAEVATILGVERPRIGRWIKRGVMPPTVANLQATPVWDRRDIERMKPWVEENRRSLRDRVAS